MVKWKYRGCVRCGGTTYMEKEDNILYEKCLMCSHKVEIKNRITTTSHLEEDKEPTATQR
jgi:DNA-directed RNA polymerase subunit RPC12/RpoP